MCSTNIKHYSVSDIPLVAYLPVLMCRQAYHCCYHMLTSYHCYSRDQHHILTNLQEAGEYPTVNKERKYVVLTVVIVLRGG